MKISYKKLLTPDDDIARTLEGWTNDPSITHLIRPNQTQSDLESFISVTTISLIKQMQVSSIYLIYLDSDLVGEMNFQIDPDHLYKKEAGTAWIGIVIGEISARGIGIGSQAMEYIEKQILEKNIQRIELGVFEFNIHAINLYKKLGYNEIGRLDDFTFWNDKMWQDIRMEKYLE